MMAYGSSADSLDEYTQMSKQFHCFICFSLIGIKTNRFYDVGKSTLLECLKQFCLAIISKYQEQYLSSPTLTDTERLLKVAEERGFPGMMGSLDFMHWSWKNCPTAYNGIYRGKKKEPTMILEAVASYDVWIWHAFFSLPGALNNINVLHQSPIFNAIQEGRGPDVNFTVNGTQYGMGYYLVDGIYPSWATLVKTISNPVGKKNNVCWA
jgi:hypothetical protein